ncbi:MAG: YlbF family regulator [Blautia sp.]|nr:YlbF family regulator [Blautia sp.]
MDELDEIERSTWELLQEIRESAVYRTYRQEEERLAADPALRERVKQFRGANFHLHQGGSDVDMQRVYEESASLQKIPQVNAYLEAELALCRLVQKVCRTLTEGIDFDAPEL